MSRKRILISALIVIAIGLLVKSLWIDDVPFWQTFQSDDHSRAAPRANQVTSRATSRPARVPDSASQSLSGTTLLRELPRQAMFITAASEFGQPACDRSVDFSGATPDAPLTCTVSFEGSGLTMTELVDVIGRDGKKIDSIELTVTSLGNSGYPDYAKVAATVEPWCDSKFAALISKTGQQPKAMAETQPAASGGLEAPAEVEALLTQIDPQRAFLAAHLLHASIAESGESPQRLAALVRAYSHLGEATRYLYSPHGSAFFARALIYAERLKRKYPDLPLSHAARGYAYALLGEPMEARRAFEDASKLAGEGGSNKLPPWASLADDLAHFRTRALFDRTDDKALAPLASYFAVLTVEHSNLQSVVINMSRLALQNNPGALRIINIMTDNSGVALQHETTAQATDAQFKLLASLASDKTVPAEIQAAANAAQQQRLAPPALLALLDAMDKQAQPTSSGGQLLPWGAYASISRDALFVSGIRRLYFASHMLATDVSGRLQSWWPILKDHRFAVVLGGFDRTGQLSGKDATARVRQVDLLQLYGRMTWMCKFVKERKVEPKPQWIENYDYTSDDTVYDLAHQLWTYRLKEFDALPVTSMIKGKLGQSLEAMCPQHPSAVAEAIVNRWPATRAKASDIERDMSSHPQVAYALARAYRFEKRYDDAARLLQSVIEISPDPDVYDELAEMYKEQGNVDKWLEIYNQYLSKGEEFGLDKARRNETIAYTLMRMKRHDRALEYARASADSGSGWGYNVYAACLTELGRYDEAEKVEQINQERYPPSLAWYRWCQTTGKGELQAARAATESIAKAIKDDRRQGRTNEAPIFFVLEGDVAAARDFWEREFQRDRDPYVALQLAMIYLAQDKPDSATTFLDNAQLEDPMQSLPAEFTKMMGGVTRSSQDSASPSRWKIYAAAIEELQRCVPDPAAVPRRDGDLKVIAEPNGGTYAGCAAYYFGRFCEIRGKKEDAVFWYRASMECGDWTIACRPQSGAGLRRLGQEYYK